MKVLVFAGVFAVGVDLVAAAEGDKCTFPTRGDSSDPACVWDDYTDFWQPSFNDFRCCLEDAEDNTDCNTSAYMHLTGAQCDAVNQSNIDCASAASYYAVGFTSTNWACEDYAPDCLLTLSCDEENGYVGTPWIMCQADGGEFEMHGCTRTAYDPNENRDRELYLPYKYFGLNLVGSGNKKTSLSSAADSCTETSCAAFTAGNGACNPLGNCRDVGDYWVYQDGDWTDLVPDVALDTYVNPFRWIGPPEVKQTAAVNDQNDADSIRMAELDYYSPMFDCMSRNKGTFKFRDQSILQIDESFSGSGVIAEQFGFTQTLLDYVVNDLGVDESLITTGPGGPNKTTPSGDFDEIGSHTYFGRISEGYFDTENVTALAGKFVGGYLMCNVNNGQGCTLDGCAYMCQASDSCEAFTLLDLCYEDDAASALRPTCDIIDGLVAASGRSGTFDRSKRAVCGFHYHDFPDQRLKYTKDATKSKAAMTVERTSGGGWDDSCVRYSHARCEECLECSDASGTSAWLLQGGCEAGNPACQASRETLKTEDEWSWYKNNTLWECGMCPLHCSDCDDANDCDKCGELGLFVVNDAGTGCVEVGCTVAVADFPARAIGDANGASSIECVEGANVEPWDYCDIVCNASFYQSTGDTLTAQCNGTTMLMEYPVIGCTACSEGGCLTCPSDVCTECATGYELENPGAKCTAVSCPLTSETAPNCVACAASDFGTISWDAASMSWDTSGCTSCGSLLTNCLNCNGTNAGDAVCIECDAGYTLDENDDCIEEQQCPEGQDGVVVYDIAATAFNFSDCTTNDACPRDGEVAPDCWDCPEGYLGSVEWVWSNFSHGSWSEAQCELVECPSSNETSPNCTACPWGYSGTAYWDDETESWAGCVSNDFGLRVASASKNRAAARSTTPPVRSRRVRVTRSADDSEVLAVEDAPYTLDREASAYFYKNNGAYSSAEDEWNCPAGYGGADCSLRLCPHSASAFGTDDELGIGASDGLYWTTEIGQKSTATFHGRHAYRECAGRGVCDYDNGECECFPGFTGRGCRRRECPNDCSGHGVCVDDDLALYHNTHALGDIDVLSTLVYPSTASSSDPNLWSAEVQQACMCDGGWTGHDCSLRLCPVGDDPETHCADELAYDVQKINCTGLDASVDHFFSLTYTTPLGTRYVTPAVIVSAFGDDNVTATPNSLQTALESLPNFVVPSVEVSADVHSVGGGDFSVDLMVTFSDPANSGEQPLLEVAYSTRCDSGSSSLFVNADPDFSCSVVRESQASDLREQAECSNRGICNTRTGECSCYDGYHGVACETMSSTI